MDFEREDAEDADDEEGRQRLSSTSGLSTGSDDADDLQRGGLDRDSLSEQPLPRNGSESDYRSHRGSEYTLPSVTAAYNLIFGTSLAEDEDRLKKLRGDLGAPGPVTTYAENKGLMPRSFQRTRLAQAIQAHDGAIYTIKFSPDGKFLATGGEDARVVVWIVGQLPAPAEESYESPAQSVVSDGNDVPSHRGSGQFSKSTTSSNRDESGAGLSLAEQGSNLEEPSISSSDREGSEINVYPLPETSDSDIIDRNIIIYPLPYREYLGHTESVLDVAWSNSNFLLSASADKFVRLWRLEDHSRCLKLFGHTDIVTSVDFHPSNDTHFISACFNGQVRLWDNIRSNTLDYALSPLDENSCNVAFTSVSFVPDGSRVFAGLKDGQILIYAYKVESADKVKINRETSLDWLRDRKGKYSNGCKVTGICFDASKGSDHKLLRWCVTSNDSNVRLVESIVPPFKYACKYKGGTNTSLQIKASFSEGGNYLICPTENGEVMFWEPDDDSTSLTCDIFGKRSETRRNASYEWFHCTSLQDNGKGKKTRVPATAAVFAPAGAVSRVLESAMEIQRRALIKKLNSSFLGGSDATLSASQIQAQIQVHPQRSSSLGTDSYDAAQPGSSSPHSARSNSVSGTLPEDATMGSTIIATSDLNGVLRIFVRSA